MVTGLQASSAGDAYQQEWQQDRGDDSVYGLIAGKGLDFDRVVGEQTKDRRHESPPVRYIML